MKRGKYKWLLIAVFFLIMILGGCGMNGKNEIITKAIEDYLQEEYGEEFEVLSWRQPKLLPSDNGAIYATCIVKSDPKHPFEGSYFYPEGENAELEVIDNDGYAERLLARQMEAKVEKAVSQVAEKYYIQGSIFIPDEWLTIPMEEITQWENYVTLCNQSDEVYYDYETIGTVWVYIDATTMTGMTDEEEYQMYEEVYRDEIGGQAMFFIYYMDYDHYQRAEEILENSAPEKEGSRLSDAEENQPYFGTIMRSGSTVFDDSLEVFKAAKQGEEQEKYK